MRAISYLSMLLSCFLPFVAHAEEYEERSILSTPEQIATLNSEPDFLVGGVIIPLSGQPVQWELVYDPLNQLIEAKGQHQSLQFTYDPLGRRLSKTIKEGGAQTKEEYLYDGQDEIGSFTSELTPKNLKIIGPSVYQNFPSTIAIELEGQPFAPIVDIQGNIRHLLDLRTKKAVNRYAYSVFGESLDTYEKVFNPWRYAAKRIDPELGLFYFGKRYYDPVLSRWLTTDPAGFIDSMNLYQYCLNNPCRYFDPNGEFIFLLLIPLSYITTTMILEAAAVATAGAIAAWVTYEACDYISRTGPGHRPYHSSTTKPIGYAPDRPLPVNSDGVPIPDTDAPHTQLGTKTSTRGRKEVYVQAREFDEYGNPVRDIDFTDHGEPHKHPNPHQHIRKPNPTGGTRSREDPEPLPRWECS